MMRPVIDPSIHAGGQIQEWEQTAKDQFQTFIEGGIRQQDDEEGGIRQQDDEDELAWLREAQQLIPLHLRARVCE